MLCVFVISLPGTLKACLPGYITPVGYFVVDDKNGDQNNTYAVYVVLTDECPGTSGSIYQTTLTSSQLGTTVNIAVGSVLVSNLPTDGESYYYFKIHIVVQKLYNGSPVGSPVTRYSYAAHDPVAGTLTAMTQPIAISF